MNTKIKNLLFVTLITTMISMSTVVQAQVRPYRVTDRQVQALLNRIETGTNTFKNSLDRSLDNSNLDGTRREDSINTMVANFENATDRLKNNFATRRSTTNDVQEVLNRAVFVNSFMLNNRMNSRSENAWNMVRTDLTTLAGYYNVVSNWNNTASVPDTRGGYYATDAQVRNLLNQLSLRSRTFSQTLDRWSRTYAGRNTVGSSMDAKRNSAELETAIRNLRLTFSQDPNASNLGPILAPSTSINGFIAGNRTTTDLSNKWNLVKRDIDTLAGYYRVSWDWSNPVMPGGQFGGFDARLTGTYQLNTRQSDSVSNAVDAAIRNANYNSTQSDRVRRNLERRLTAPNVITLEKVGQRVTMSSANAAAITLTADGINHPETTTNGRTVNTNVSASDTDLTINYEGDRMNDYFVSFAPQSNGQLKVTRRIYIENKNDAVTAISVYDKTSQTPQWNTAPVNNNVGSNDRFLILNNTNLVATLDSPLSTRTANDGDRFSMTVTSPSQYNGAVIEGSVSGKKSGVVSGNANMSLNFETIRLRNGQSYRFSGLIEQVRMANGDVLNVNNEGLVRDDSQTKKTVTRAGIGAVLGAIIGAIADGGSGAAIGAGVGAGAGAGTVVLQGRDNLEIARGAQFNITATSPANLTGQVRTN